MEIRRELVAPCGTDELFAWVDDLDRYPEWMRLVHAVTALDGAVSDGAMPAWQVELRAQVGPFARSKVLRMVRTVHDAPSRAVFERAEVDGREHSPWRLAATVEPHLDVDDDTVSSRLTMELSYGGSLWTGAVLERVLDDAVRRGSERLLELVRAGSAGGPGAETA